MAEQQAAQDYALLVVRAAAGAMLVGFHGWGKLTSIFAYLVQGVEWPFIAGVAALGFPFPALFAICAGLAESVGSVLLFLGLWTRYAALAILMTMSVAVYRHVTSDFRFELAAMYWLVALLFVLVPPGRFSLDFIRARAR